MAIAVPEETLLPSPTPQNSLLRPLKLKAPSRRYPQLHSMRDEQNLEKEDQGDCEFKASLNYRE